MSRLSIPPNRPQGSAALAGTALVGAPAIRAQDRSLKVGVYGGYFKDSFEEHVFPKFEADTGIAVESVAEPTGEAWVVQLQQAARAGQVPADVNMMSQGAMMTGQAVDLWSQLDMEKMPNAKAVLDRYINRYPDGSVCGVGAVT